MIAWWWALVAFLAGLLAGGVVLVVWSEALLYGSDDREW